MKRAHGFSNAAHDCVQNNVLKHSLGKFSKNVAWFNQGRSRTRGSINCQPTLDRADEFLHFCGPCIFCCPLIDFPNLDWNSIRITGRPFCSRTTLFCKTSSERRRRPQRICLLCISRCPSERRAQVKSDPNHHHLFPPHSLELVKSDAPNGATRALAFHHMLCR